MVKIEKNRLSKILRHPITPWIVLALFVAVHSFYIYNYHIKDVLGPTMGHDEFVYFALANSIAEKMSYLGHAQYNPLYPFITSFFVLLTGSKMDAFEWMKIFNCVIVSSAAIPFYLISKRLIKRTGTQIIVSMVLVLYPWKVVANLIVAEPLFFFLMVWYMYLFLLFVEKRTMFTAVALGVCGGLLFLAKQAGITLIIATAIAFVYDFIFLKCGDQKGKLKQCGSFLTAAAVVIVPWLIRNMLVTGTLMGYQSEVDNVADNFNIMVLLHSYFSQISYLALSCHIVFLAIFIVALQSIRKQKNSVQLFWVLTAFCALGFMGMGALHHLLTPYAPYGRYVSMATLFVILCAVGYIEQQKHSRKRYAAMTLCSVLLGGIAFAFNGIPVSMLVKGNYNQFDLGALRWMFFDGDLTHWGVDYTDPALIEKTGHYIVAITLLAVAVMLFSMLKEKILHIYMVCVFLFAAYCGNYVCNAQTTMMASFNQHTEVFCYLEEQNIDLETMYQMQNIAIVSDMDIAWMEDFGRKRGEVGIDSITPDQLYKDTALKIDFGPDNDDVAEGYMAVKAPWRGEYLFTETSLLGFDAGMTFKEQTFWIDSQKTDTANTPVSDVIFGTTENVFYINNGGGVYDFSLMTNGYGVGERLLDCDVYINDDYVGSFSSANTTINLSNYDTGEGIIAIRFVPKENCVWTIGAIELTPQQSKGYYNTYILMNAAEITPLEVFFENDAFKVCYKQ